MRSASRILLSAWDEGAVTAMARGLREETGGAALAVVFVSADWRGQLGELIEILQIEGHARRVVGSSAGGIIGTGQEDEDVSGCTVLFLDWHGAVVRTWPIDEQFQIPPGLTAPGGISCMVIRRRRR